MKKCVITVVGKDTVGIIAKVCEYLARTNINILDISQTIVDGYFNMMMIVDVTNCRSSCNISQRSFPDSSLERCPLSPITLRFNGYG